MGMRKNSSEEKNRDSCKKPYKRPALEKRERLIEVTEGSQGVVTP